MQQTLGIIKPDATKNKHIGKILDKIEQSNLNLLNIKMLMLTKKEAKQFYKIHQNKPFFDDLVTYMSSGLIVILKLEGHNAIEDYRKLIGNTDPKTANKGTIRNLYGKNKSENAIHGSDNPKSAKEEINFFFK